MLVNLVPAVRHSGAVVGTGAGIAAWRVWGLSEWSFSPCAHAGFPPDASPLKLHFAHRCEFECEWLSVSICQPCDRFTLPLIPLQAGVGFGTIHYTAILMICVILQVTGELTFTCLIDGCSLNEVIFK